MATLEDLAIGYLAGAAEFTQDELRQSLDDKIKATVEICKKNAADCRLNAARESRLARRNRVRGRSSCASRSTAIAEVGNFVEIRSAAAVLELSVPAKPSATWVIVGSCATTSRTATWSPT